MRTLFTGTLFTAICAASMALSGTAIAGEKAQAEGEAKLAKLLEGRVAGKPVSCIPQRMLESSTTIDGTAIVYRSGRRLYVNRPRSGADSLDSDQILVTRLTGSELCNIDTVKLVDRSSGFPEGFVILGDFVPYERVKPTPAM